MCSTAAFRSRRCGHRRRFLTAWLAVTISACCASDGGVDGLAVAASDTFKAQVHMRSAAHEPLDIKHRILQQREGLAVPQQPNPWHRRLLAQPAQHASVESTLDPWERNYGPYYVFHNVLLQHKDDTTSLYFYESASRPSEVPVPQEVVIMDHKIAINKVHIDAHSPASQPSCARQESKPAMLFSGSPWDHNVFHFFNDNFMPVFQTLVEQGLISPHDYDHGPKQDPAPLTLVALGASSYETRWKYLQEYLTTDLRLAADTDGTCFRTLIVSFSTLLRWFHPHDTELPQRTAALRDVQHFLRQAEKLHAQEQGRPPLLVLHDSVNYKRPRVTIASRPLDRGYNVRGLVNEQEIVDWIEARYDVNVTLTEFSMPLLESMTLMEDTDVFFGMHGAGLTNTMFQKPGGVMIQMFPYGWEPKPGQFIRGDYYERMAVANECHYLTWINPHASNAHFYESDFPEPERKLWQKHPSDSMQMPTDWNPPLYWIYQSTYVDMESFGVAIDQAFKLLNYAPREQTLPQQHEK